MLIINVNITLWGVKKEIATKVLATLRSLLSLTALLAQYRNFCLLSLRTQQLRSKLRI